MSAPPPYNPNVPSYPQQNYGGGGAPGYGFPQQPAPAGYGYPSQQPAPAGYGYPPQQQPYYAAHQTQPQVVVVERKVVKQKKHRREVSDSECCLWALLACCCGCCLAGACN